MPRIVVAFHNSWNPGGGGGRVARRDVLSPREVFARQLIEVRGERGWTQQRLAAALTQVGHPLGHKTISAIERGDRNVLLEDVVAIARALGCSPLRLMTPARTETVAATRKGGAVIGSDYECWLLGEAPLPGASAQAWETFYDLNGDSRVDSWIRRLFPRLQAVRDGVREAMRHIGPGPITPAQVKAVGRIGQQIAEDAALIERDVRRFKLED